MKGPTQRRFCRLRQQGGFTFVEILAALSFLAILIPAVLGALSLGNRAAVAAERSSLAAELAEYELGQLKVGNAWQSGGSRGDFGADYPGYRWELEQTSWTGDTNNPMEQLTVRVFFQVQGREREVHLSTLVSNTQAQQ